jgi:hypothetical protein
MVTSSSSSAVALVVALAVCTSGCVHNRPPPPMPERAVITPEVVPTVATAASDGRLVVDVVGEKAKVFEVTELTTRTNLALGGKNAWMAPAQLDRKMRPLCLTPCAIDLPLGWHSLVFESTSEPLRTSTADVTVAAQPTAVRHALGREKPANGGYVGGIVMLLPAGGLLVMGTIATVVGATAKDPGPSTTGGNTKGDARVFLPVGLVLLGIGAVLGIGGSILIANNAPERQPGSTTQWALP